MINLLVASDKEFKTVVTLFSTLVGIKKTNCINTVAGYYNDKQISVHQIGIGKTNTCMSLHFLSNIEGKFINIGTCCSLTMGLKLGQPIEVVACCQWDFDVLEGPGQLNSRYLPRDRYQTFGTHESPFHKVVCATGDSFVTKENVEKIKQDFPKASVADMEVAAIRDFFRDIHPFRSFKVVSDYANFDEYERNWDKVTEGFKKILDYLTVGKYE